MSLFLLSFSPTKMTPKKPISLASQSLFFIKGLVCSPKMKMLLLDNGRKRVFEKIKSYVTGDTQIQRGPIEVYTITNYVTHSS